MPAAAIRDPLLKPDICSHRRAFPGGMEELNYCHLSPDERPDRLAPSRESRTVIEANGTPGPACFGRAGMRASGAKPGDQARDCGRDALPVLRGA